MAHERYLSAFGKSPSKKFLIVTYSLTDLKSLKSFLATAMFSVEILWIWSVVIFCIEDDVYLDQFSWKLTLHSFPCFNWCLITLDLILHESGEVLNHFAKLVTTVYKIQLFKLSWNISIDEVIEKQLSCLWIIHQSRPADFYSTSKLLNRLNQVSIESIWNLYSICWRRWDYYLPVEFKKLIVLLRFILL